MEIPRLEANPYGTGQVVPMMLASGQYGNGQAGTAALDRADQRDGLWLSGITRNPLTDLSLVQSEHEMQALQEEKCLKRLGAGSPTPVAATHGRNDRRIHPSVQRIDSADR